MPGNDITVATRRETGQRWRWYKPVRCSICTSFIWFQPIALKEAVGAPEPRHEWVLCKPCHEALLVEVSRSSLRSPARLRIAMGLVAAERSPTAYTMSTPTREQREFAWFTRLLILFALLHLVILVVLWRYRNKTVPYLVESRDLVIKHKTTSSLYIKSLLWFHYGVVLTS